EARFAAAAATERLFERDAAVQPAVFGFQDAPLAAGFVLAHDGVAALVARQLRQRAGAIADCVGRPLGAVGRAGVISHGLLARAHRRTTAHARPRLRSAS